ncbi:MAG: hypothetical protein IPL86_15785 [Flavobacteriales bacterium]|nr:hypothetical protein [Flavobacteriales bacterium]
MIDMRVMRSEEWDGKRVYAEQVKYFSAVQPLDLSAEWKDGLYLVMVRVEGQAPRSARVVVKR